MPEGVVCLALAGGLQVSAVRIDKILRDPGASTASVPAMPVPDIADRRHGSARHQAADAGVVARHASAWPRQEGNIQHRAGPAAGDLDQRCLAASAQADASHARARRRYKLGAAGPRIEIDDAYIGGERTGEGSGRGRRGHTPFIVAIETSDDGRPLHARLQVVRGFQAGETKRLCSAVEAGTTVVSDGGQWFPASPNSRASSISATSPALIAGLRATRPSAGRIRCWPMSKTASWPPIAWSAPNICHVTSAPSLGVSTAALF